MATHSTGINIIFGLLTITFRPLFMLCNLVMLRGLKVLRGIRGMKGM